MIASWPATLPIDGPNTSVVVNARHFKVANKNSVLEANIHLVKVNIT